MYNSDTNLKSVGRLFIAIGIPADAGLKRFIAELKEDLSAEKMRFTPVDNLHITLRFLGDTPMVKVPELKRVMEEVSGREESFSFRLQGLGVFRNVKTARVLWTGIVPDDHFGRLKSRLESGLGESGFDRDDRGFNPHLTLARMKFIADRQGLEEILDRNKDRHIMNCYADRITLYESILRREGAEYRVLGDFSLSLP